MKPEQHARPGSHFAAGLVSLLLMIASLYFFVADDVALGAALFAIGAAIAPSAAWWRSSHKSE